MSDSPADIRAEALRLLATELGRLPVRWADRKTLQGDVDGREATVEVFDVPAANQMALRRSLRVTREAVERRLGMNLRLIFHTPEATSEHYGFVRAGHAPVYRDLTLVPRPDISDAGLQLGNLSGRTVYEPGLTYLGQ